MLDTLGRAKVRRIARIAEITGLGGLSKSGLAGGVAHFGRDFVLVVEPRSRWPPLGPETALLGKVMETSRFSPGGTIHVSCWVCVLQAYMLLHACTTSEKA